MEESVETLVCEIKIAWTSFNSLNADHLLPNSLVTEVLSIFFPLRTLRFLECKPVTSLRNHCVISSSWQ